MLFDAVYDEQPVHIAKNVVREVDFDAADGVNFCRPQLGKDLCADAYFRDAAVGERLDLACRSTTSMGAHGSDDKHRLAVAFEEFHDGLENDHDVLDAATRRSDSDPEPVQHGLVGEKPFHLLENGSSNIRRLEPLEEQAQNEDARQGRDPGKWGLHQRVLSTVTKFTITRYGQRSENLSFWHVGTLSRRSTLWSRAGPDCLLVGPARDNNLPMKAS
jgi:hypothetical protein